MHNSLMPTQTTLFTTLQQIHMLASLLHGASLADTEFDDWSTVASASRLICDLTETAQDHLLIDL